MHFNYTNFYLSTQGVNIMELVKNFIEYTMVDCIIRNRVVRNKIQVSFCTYALTCHLNQVRLR